jgi:hypothetical protein
MYYSGNMFRLAIESSSGPYIKIQILNSLNTELNPICHLLALLGAHPILHVSRITVNLF